MILLEGGSHDVAVMGMEREWAFNEPAATEWLRDEATDVKLDGHLALLYFTDRP